MLLLPRGRIHPLIAALFFSGVLSVGTSAAEVPGTSTQKAADKPLIDLPVAPLLEVKPGQIGTASWYGHPYVGRTASGERYRPQHRTAAHRTLAFGSKVTVTNLKNNKSVVVRINDRGPFIKGRIIDLSRQAAADLGLVKSGIAQVQVDVLARELGVVEVVAIETKAK